MILLEEPRELFRPPDGMTNGEDMSGEPEILALGAAIDVKDHLTYVHSKNVAIYAVTLSRNLQFPEEKQKVIYQAGLLHDAGKIVLPEEVLGKPGSLTEEEYTLVKGHVTASVEILRRLPRLSGIIPAVCGHHERWDGKGYPEGLKGEEITPEARCIAIADAYDAMTSKRPYKPPMTSREAEAEILRNAGTQFDPEYAEVFVLVSCPVLGLLQGLIPR